MNEKGFAVSGVLYSILLLFMILMISMISMLGDRRTILEKIKREVLGETSGNIAEVYNDAKGVNKPQLSEGMTPIKWVNGVETVTTVDDPEWYDYSNQSWANVKTKDGSYWVWIPRYAYKITSGYHSSTAGAIDVKFLKGSTNFTKDGTDIESSGYVAGVKDTSKYYFTHPAFQNTINKYGYWVAKFEPTAVEGVANDYTSGSLCPIEGDDVSTKTIKIIPNVQSWRCISIFNAYKTALAMKQKNLYGWDENSVDTHIMTNLEWGAIYYLTMSTSGANNNEVYINNSQKYITGCAGNTSSEPTYNGCQNTYESLTGIKSSSTWNITGIYDMSGGAWERTMGVYNNLISNSGFSTEEYDKLPAYHITKYSTPTANLLNNTGMDYDDTIYGDGMYETSISANRYNGSTWVGSNHGEWNGEYSEFPYVAAPWLGRGGAFDYNTTTGLGSFSYFFGEANGRHSFRPIVSITK